MRRYLLRPLFWVFLLVGLVFGLVAANPASPQTGVQFEFAPARLTLIEGAQGQIDVRLVSAHDLASFEMDLAFDPAVVSVERVERVIGTASQPTPNRTWVSLPTSDDPNTTYLVLGPGRIAFGAFSLSEGTPSVVEGDLTLVRLHVRAVRQGTSVLRPERVLITDSLAEPGQATTTTGEVVVTAPPFQVFLPYLAQNQTAPAKD